MKLWVKILLGMAVGVVVGIALGPQATFLRPIGTIFLSLINMLVVLLVFSSMTVGITSIHDPKKLGRIGGKTLLLYFATTVVAILIGMAFAKWIQPGVGVGLEMTGHLKVEEPPGLSDIILGVVPSNPVAALAQGDILKVIVFSVFLGMAINFAGEKGKPLLRVLESLAEAMYRLTGIVMKFAPYGVCGIMAWVAGTFGVGILWPLVKFLTAHYLACIVHTIVIFGGMLWLMARLNPFPFFKGMGDAMAVAFTTTSSSATLPVSMHCTQANLGVSRNITSFVLPLGSTVNMNGTAIYQAIAAFFIAQAYGINLEWTAIITIVATATLSAVGTAGIPGSGFIMLSAVLVSAGLPIEGLAILAGIDRLRDMIGTVVNILGDAVVAVVVAKKEGELNVVQYNHADIVAFEESDA